MYEVFDSFYEERLDKAKIPTLYVRRLRTMSLETFKILNNMSPPVLSYLVKLRDNTVYNLSIIIFYRYRESAAALAIFHNPEGLISATPGA